MLFDESGFNSNFQVQCAGDLNVQVELTRLFALNWIRMMLSKRMTLQDVTFICILMISLSRTT